MGGPGNNGILITVTIQNQAICAVSDAIMDMGITTALRLNGGFKDRNLIALDLDSGNPFEHGNAGAIASVQTDDEAILNEPDFSVSLEAKAIVILHKSQVLGRERAAMDSYGSRERQNCSVFDRVVDEMRASSGTGNDNSGGSGASAERAVGLQGIAVEIQGHIGSLNRNPDTRSCIGEVGVQLVMPRFLYYMGKGSDDRGVSIEM